MSMMITLPDTLSLELENRASAQHTTPEELAVQLLGDVLSHPHDPLDNDRRVALIRKRFARGLTPDEESELSALQVAMDQQLESMDRKMLGDAQAMLDAVKQELGAGSPS